MTNLQQEQLAQLKEIRNLMEKSSKFISLSGLSGVSAGVCALIGAMLAYMYIGKSPLETSPAYYYEEIKNSTKWGLTYNQFLILNAIFTAGMAKLTAFFFTQRKAKEKGQKIWDKTVQRLLFAMAIPLATGGIFCLTLLKNGDLAYIAPATLIFYGLALVNGSKYTFDNILYLGISQIILGLIGMLWLRHGLEIWAIGFGILHILYGILMYRKEGI